MNDQKLKFDILVIGSGAGGALAAYGLQKQGFNVCMLEKGPWAKQNLKEVRAFTHYYKDQGLVGAFGNSFIGVPTGEVVGGTTKINSGTCFDTPKEIVDTWQKHYKMNIAYDELSPHFKTLRELLHISPVPTENMAKGNLFFQKGIEALGYKNHFPLHRAAKACTGSGRCCFICPKDAKQSTDVSIIPNFLKEGGTLFSQTEVTGIEEQKEGVRITCKTSALQAKKLIISAGSLSTPILIRKNKLGTHWKKAGLGLTIHPASKVFGEFLEPVYGWRGVPQALGFKHPNFPTLSFEGVFTPPALSGLVMPLEGKRLRGWLEKYDHVGSFGVMLKDTNTGWVRAFPGIGPLLHYSLHPNDFKNLIEGLRFIGLSYLASGAKRILLPISGIQNEFESFEALKQFNFSKMRPSQLYSMGFHPLGTCGMGRVVDSHLKLIGSNHIYVCDGSVVPTSLGVNPQITIMALALRLSNRFSKNS
ncbi:MAG: hypothetical protein A3B70_04140 [Deltaproteobacteria bacterium RIFCSPHIGHO2_02_FULL_40_11]|nr:MAG: hypothetical protein A3B70_04140 [Deltaproteobacteria bacterium RIFCSPHIGHO2_02_FULL_40_11]